MLWSHHMKIIGILLTQEFSRKIFMTNSNSFVPLYENNKIIINIRVIFIPDTSQKLYSQLCIILLA